MNRVLHVAALLVEVRELLVARKVIALILTLLQIGNTKHQKHRS